VPAWVGGASDDHLAKAYILQRPLQPRSAFKVIELG
jgi:hypothetical protein